MKILNSTRISKSKTTCKIGVNYLHFIEATERAHFPPKFQPHENQCNCLLSLFIFIYIRLRYSIVGVNIEIRKETIFFEGIKSQSFWHFEKKFYSIFLTLSAT